MSKLFLQLGLALSIGIIAIFVRNFEIVKWWFSNPSQTHLTTDGVITDSDIFHTGIHGGWRFDIRYEYFVDGIRYINSTVHFGYQASSDKSYAEGYLLKYPKGKNITVYYDTRNHALSVLEPDVKWLGLGYELIGFTLLSIILFYLSWLYKSKEQTSN